MRPNVLAGAAPLLVLLVSCSAWAGQPGAVAVALASDTDVSRVYPPLPTLAMLPPSTGDDDALPASHSVSRKRKARQHDCHCAMPSPRLVVSDASRVYLKDIERQLDVALAR
ncbi:hypothetical protein ACFSHT_15255 [Paraburkholderia silviterrae]|uniref:Uncharacterized protein n=1 Tax=Paraburkholderia silviterrae TaxID=2528715 RepID=A0A4R5M9P0_9BURK|nr:hypothetical protein [Paraburkholderia silviterrae]TDG23336.1 hypothetical protein EYW47_15560 [Paraburkholderia silviterrae]